MLPGDGDRGAADASAGRAIEPGATIDGEGDDGGHGAAGEPGERKISRLLQPTRGRTAPIATGLPPDPMARPKISRDQSPRRAAKTPMK